MKQTGLDRLEVWVDARVLALRVYREVVPRIPSHEQWGMASQFRRASVSIVANIAEGYGRYYFQERIRFCYFARGSLEEVATLLVLAQDLGYLGPELAGELTASVRGLGRKLNGYIRFLRRRSMAASPSRLIRKQPPAGRLARGDESS